MKPAWWKNEDWLAVAMGTAFLIAAAAGLQLAMPPMKWADGKSLLATLSFAPQVVLICAVFLAASLPGIALLGGNLAKYAIGFPFVFLIAWLAQVAAGNRTASYWGIEYVIFALFLGIAISNGPGNPTWLKEAVRTEYFIKTGLVIMGATILFEDVLSAGALGMLQAILVVTVVWYIAFAICKKMRLDDEFSAILASAVSICGVSAAIATCGAIQGDRKKLSYVASIVLIVAVPMIVIMPWIIRATNMPDAVAGAWLGGTLDTTGSVVAAGALISEKTMKVGTIVKFSQNVLLGLAAFLLAMWWSFKKPSAGVERPRLGVIWERFPKFVLGFMAASVVFSFFIPPAVVQQSKGMIAGLRTWWFAMAFASIGLETRFGDLMTMEGGRPLLAFLYAQAANVVWTLLLAWLIFGGILFKVPV